MQTQNELISFLYTCQSEADSTPQPVFMLNNVQPSTAVAVKIGFFRLYADRDYRLGWELIPFNRSDAKIALGPLPKLTGIEPHSEQSFVTYTQTIALLDEVSLGNYLLRAQLLTPAKEELNSMATYFSVTAKKNTR